VGKEESCEVFTLNDTTNTVAKANSPSSTSTKEGKTCNPTTFNKRA